MPTLTAAQWLRWGLSHIDKISQYVALVGDFTAATDISGKIRSLVALIELTGSILESLSAQPREAVACDVLEVQLLDAMEEQPGHRGIFDRQHAGKLLKIGFGLLKLLGPMVAPQSAPLFDLLARLEAIGS